MRIRAFIALPLSQLFQDQFSRFQNALRPFLRLPSVRFVRPDVAHITLRFFESLEESDVGRVESLVDDAVSGMPSFLISCAHVGGFPSLNHCKILWRAIGSGENSIINLKNQIDFKLASLGFPLEDNFVPHLTIARFRTASSVAQMLDQARDIVAQFELVETIDSVCLFKSTLLSGGPQYEVLSKAPLQTPKYN